MSIESKIKKLLRLSSDQGATMAEAESALAAAMRLAAEHRVDMVRLRDETDGTQSACVDRAILCKKGIGCAEQKARSIAAHFFGVRTIRDNNGYEGVKLIFVGLPSDVDIAMHVFIYLSRCFRGAWQIARAKNRRLKREAYLDGLMQGVASKLAEMRREAEASITAIQPSLQAYIDKKWGDTVVTKTVKSKPIRAHRSSMEGYLAGRKIDIHTPLETAVTESPDRLN